MTARLYYTDPYLAEFDAEVTSLEQHDAVSPALTLDRTALYPIALRSALRHGLAGRRRGR